MHAATSANSPPETLTKLVHGASTGLSHLSDSELLATTRGLVGASNHVFAALLVHLAEVETRGLYRLRSCSSLYTYCIYELRFSEDAASRRAGAAKLVKRFPVLFEAIANGELHLTGLLTLGPHLTPENHVEVLARAKFRTKKEIAKLVRTLAPLPDVPDSIEPVRAALVAPRNPTWAEFVESLCPPVRELRPGERPQDWANDAELTPALARVAEPPSELPPLTGPLLYQVQFTATEEHVTLVERAKALLSHRSIGTSLGDLHLQAMRLLVAQLERKRFGAAPSHRPPRAVKRDAPAIRQNHESIESADGLDHPRQRDDAGSCRDTQPGGEPHQRGDAQPNSDPRQRGNSCPDREPPSDDDPRQRGDSPPDGHEPPGGERERGRYIPVRVRRQVFERDGGRCAFVDERGQRCRETHWLEVHHLQPFERAGQHEIANLALRCHAHNALAAEQDFGRAHVEKRRESRHESRRRSDGD